MTVVTSADPLSRRRELIPDGETGGLVIFEDAPNFWDAWGVSILFIYRRFRSEVICSDVEIHHLEKRQPLKFGNISVLEEGPLRAAVLAELKYGKSSINVVVRYFLPLGFFVG